MAILEWLAKALDCIAPELRELVEEEHTVMPKCVAMYSEADQDEEVAE